jgi:hypothetical protein
MSVPLNVSQAADEVRRLTGTKVAAERISRMFYHGKLDTDRCPIINGRRQIPPEYIPDICRELRRAGYLPTIESKAVQDV